MLAFLYTQNRVGGKIPSTLKIIEPDFLVPDSRRYYNFIVESCATDESDCYFCRSIFIDAINAFIYTWIKAF